MVVLAEILQGSSSSSSIHDASHKYDVFLSFRGDDTRDTFTDHLYDALLNANLITFLDDEEIRPGEDLKPELENAIKASRASIIVLSKKYAFSTWCLDELVLILEQRLISDQIVIPVFYHVEPTHVRKQESSFGDAMAGHTQRMEAEANSEKRSQWAQKIDQWRKALTEVADLKGMDVNGSKETQFIDEIVTNIHLRLGGPSKSSLPPLFGMQDSIEFINSWLKDGSSNNTDILTISGMGGIGKTSLARYVYGLHRHLFDKSSFIEGIGETCAALKIHGLLDLQKQLCGDISKSKTSQTQVHDSLAYTSMIENALSRKKVFIVLDDIDSPDQLHALLGKQGFHRGSKIIITTKDASLTEKYAPINAKVRPKHTKHPLKGLRPTASLQLLCHHAFMSNGPKEGYEEVSKKIMEYCEGHPLALKVLGRSLCNNTVAEWEDCIEGLKKETDSRIQKALQMSFDSMPYDNDKELFKHIACFFVHEDRDFAETILKSCGIRTLLGIRNLIDRCLLTISPGNVLMMHQLIQEMGRDLVRQESPDKPEERSRLWRHEESFNVLEENKGTTNIKGLVIDMKMLEIEMSCGEVELETKALSKMKNLMLLHLNFVQLSGSYKKFPQKLRWLCMRGFPLNSIPPDLPMQNLVALDMSYSNIESFDMCYSNPQPPAKRQKGLIESSSKDKRMLGSLKILDLSFCEQLRSLGGFFQLPALERLIVKNCVSLIEVCESIERCVELVLIDLSSCHKLNKLPISLSKLNKVKTLLLDGCNLGESRIEMWDMDSSDISINSEASSSAIMEAIPRDLAIYLPRSLVKLSLIDNNLSNESFPMDWSSLSMLKELYLNRNPIVTMPICVRTLPRLETLSMNACNKLMSIEHPPPTLRVFLLYFSEKRDLPSLQKITFVPEMSPLSLDMSIKVLARSSVEIEGMVKVQPMASVEDKLLRSLGWTNLEFIMKSRVRTYDDDRRGAEEFPIQMYYEFGIFSTFYGGEKMPNWIGLGSEGPSISFKIPSSPKKITGLNFCYVLLGQYEAFFLPQIRISNITKNRTWIYEHYIEDEVKVGGKWLTMLSHWMFGMNEMEAGDEITITVGKYRSEEYAPVFNQLTNKCGVRVVYDDGKMEDEEDALGYSLEEDRSEEDEAGASEYSFEEDRSEEDEAVASEYSSEEDRSEEDEAGDEITISADETVMSDQVIKECGVGFVYDDGKMEEEEDALGYYKSWNHIIGGDLSAFQKTTGEYSLYHHRFMQYGYTRPSFYPPKDVGFKEYRMRFKAFTQRK